MIDAFKDGMSKYVDFTGVASRSQYWYFILACFIIGFVAGLLGAFVAPDTTFIITLLLNVVLFLPSLAVAVRRLHDSDHSGWWVLFPIVGFIMLLFPTKPNRFNNQEAIAATN